MQSIIGTHTKSVGAILDLEAIAHLLSEFLTREEYEVSYDGDGYCCCELRPYDSVVHSTLTELLLNEVLVAATLLHSSSSSIVLLL